MSFVGTRPEATKYVEKYSNEMLATLLLPAGITSEATEREKLFRTQKVIDPKNLKELDTANVIIPYGADGAEVPYQKYRDVFKILCAMEDENAVYGSYPRFLCPGDHVPGLSRGDLRCPQGQSYDHRCGERRLLCGF